VALISTNRATRLERIGAPERLSFS